MKRIRVITTLAVAFVAMSLGIFLHSCTDEDYWPYSPPPGWGANYFYDSRLDGAWELVQANSEAVTGKDTNYLDFFGRGHGRYYYYSNSVARSEEMAYFCQKSNSSTSNYQINIQYESGGASTMAYWFTDSGNNLWMQWKTNGGQTIVYVYSRVGGVPW